MKKYLLLFSMLLFAGCSIFQSHESSLVEPKVLKQSPLPPIPNKIASENLELLCEFLVREDGTIEKARLLRSSGDETWDYLAELTLLKWEFSPALLDGSPIKLLLKKKIKVNFAEPERIPLAEIQFNTIAEAETVYAALQSGKDFAQLAEQYSISSSKTAGGKLGKIDIQMYSTEIRRVLELLDEGEYTQPISYGDHYIIFKRLKDKNGI